MNTLKTTLNLKNAPESFVSRDLAFNLAATATKPQRVMLGEGRYLVVCPADAVKMEAAGYEYAG